MKRAFYGLLLTMILSFCFSGPVLACHDQGQGKSQDCNDLGDIATAPEPSTTWLFLIGVLGVAAASRFKPSRSATVTLK